MPPPVFVEGIADSAGALLSQGRAVKLSSAFVLAWQPTTSVLGAHGAATGVYYLDLASSSSGVLTSFALAAEAPLTIDNVASVDMTSGPRTWRIAAADGSNRGTQSPTHYTLTQNATDAATAGALVRRGASAEASFGPLVGTTIAASTGFSGPYFSDSAGGTLPTAGAVRLGITTAGIVGRTGAGANSALLDWSSGDVLAMGDAETNDLTLYATRFAGFTAPLFGAFGGAGGTKPAITGDLANLSTAASMIAAMASLGWVTNSATGTAPTASTYFGHVTIGHAQLTETTPDAGQSFAISGPLPATATVEDWMFFGAGFGGISVLAAIETETGTYEVATADVSATFAAKHGTNAAYPTAVVSDGAQVRLYPGAGQALVDASSGEITVHIWVKSA